MSEYIITHEQIDEINKSLGGMQFATSWLSCYAIWDTSNVYPTMKSKHVAVMLPEIVRCRDCRHMHVVRSWLGMDVTECWLHADPESGALGKEPTEPDGFCAWGERKEAGE